MYTRISFELTLAPVLCVKASAGRSLHVMHQLFALNHNKCFYSVSLCHVPCLQHDESEYGEHMDAASGAHSGGPFRVRVHADMRVEELRKAIWVRYKHVACRYHEQSNALS